MTKKYSGERELIVQTVTRPFDVATGLRLSEEFYGFVFPVCLALVPFPSHSLCCVCVCVCVSACMCMFTENATSKTQNARSPWCEESADNKRESEWLGERLGARTTTSKPYGGEVVTNPLYAACTRTAPM